MKQVLQISGMSCAHCVKAVRLALESLEGVEVDEVSVGGATIDIEPGIDAETMTGRVREAIDAEGYQVVQNRTIAPA